MLLKTARWPHEIYLTRMFLLCQTKITIAGMSHEISRLLQRPWFQLLMVMTGVILKAVAYMRADISPEHFIMSNRGKYSSGL